MYSIPQFDTTPNAINVTQYIVSSITSTWFVCFGTRFSPGRLSSSVTWPAPTVPPKPDISVGGTSSPVPLFVDERKTYVASYVWEVFCSGKGVLYVEQLKRETN